MKNKIFLALLLFIAISCSTEKKETLNETFQRINDEVLQNSKAYSTLEEATSTIGHRLTGSENGKKAEEYTYNKFKEYGFEDVKFVEFEVEAWSRGTIDVKIDGQSVPAVTLGHSPTEAKLKGQIVDMGNGLEADYAAKPNTANGKIALIYIGILEGSEPGLSNLHRSEKTSIAIKNGATGVIIINQVENGVLLTGTASVTGELLTIPAVCIGKETGMALKEKLKTKKVEAEINMTNNSNMIKARDVVATLPGSEFPNERIIIGGHLDSWDLATGAIDNGIGSFSILDIARAFKANQLQPKRTVQFVMFMGEEQGLLGSTYMVEKEVENGTIDNVKYMMNIDMGGNPIGINAGGKLDDTLFFKNLGAEIQKIDSTFTNQQSNRSGLHSDHQPFMLEGVPILGIIGNLDRSIYKCYHSDCDDFDLVNEAHMRNTARFGTMILYGLTNAEKLPATKMDSETTKQFMIDNGLEEALRIGGDWKWKD
ncbi:MAG: M20/M25/M40 family metallo-hydrolase [Flammeovirgaceae bacterium]|nr:M20/M25/M40 family metallo-hydrolase [Flammeovirgaceae bacterium]